MGRLIDADALEREYQERYKLFTWEDGEREKATLARVIQMLHAQPTIEPEVKFIRLPNENPVDMFPLLTSEEKQQSREYAQGYSDALADRKKGKWIELDFTEAWEYKCDQCGRRSDFKDNFCPNCGAEMRGEQHEADCD